MNEEQNDNSEANPGAPGKNPAGDGGGAALRTAGGAEEIRSEALRSSPNSQLLASSSSAELRSADPFFSGRKHFPELDGLRGLAILMVLATHYAMIIPTNNWAERGIKNILTHGWAGVDLFFVLSGFLITGILVDSKGQGNYFRNFYARRTLRIFPLYYGFLAVLLLGLIASNIAGHWDRSLPHLTNLWQIQPWLWTYTFNIACAFGHGFVYLGQLWSLSVEEQFYLIWPLIIFLLPRKFLAPACTSLIFAALFLRVLFLFAMPKIDVYFLTITRMDSLAFGALVAVVARGQRAKGLPSSANWAMTIAGGLLGFRFFFALSQWLQRSQSTASGKGSPNIALIWDKAIIFSVIGIFFAAVLIKTVAPGQLGKPTAFRRLFSQRPLRTAGKYSYGWYVFHFPIWIGSLEILDKWRILKPLRDNLTAAAGLVLANFFVSLAAAAFSYHLYEKHFLKLKKYFPERTINPPAKAPAGESANP